MNWWSHLSRAEVQVAPSILGADFGRLAEEVRDVEAAGADLLHLDIMDGHFVPNLTFGPDICRSIAKVAQRPLDAHLMISQPERYIETYREAGCLGLTLHLEAVAAPLPLLAEIRQMGGLAGLSLNPDSPLPGPGPLWEAIDLLLIMSVQPGFCGQSFQAQVLDKLAAAKRLRDEAGLDFALSIDGGVGPAVAGDCRRAGADILVAASAVMGRADRPAAIAELKRAAHAGAPSD